MLDDILVLFLDHDAIDIEDRIFPVSSNFEFCFVVDEGDGTVLGKQAMGSLEPFIVIGQLVRHVLILWVTVLETLAWAMLSHVITDHV